jgi:hypothetical protein
VLFRSTVVAATGVLDFGASLAGKGVTCQGTATPTISGNTVVFSTGANGTVWDLVVSNADGSTYARLPLALDFLDTSGNGNHPTVTDVTLVAYTVPTAYTFGTSLANPHFKRVSSDSDAVARREDRFTLYDSPQDGSALIAVQAYTLNRTV